MIVIDSLARGPAFGGIRRVAYADEAAGIADAHRLAAAMTRKCALAELPAGGAKTVIFDGPELDRDGAYARVGELVEGLAGDYVCGPDVGTGEAELALVRAHTRWVNPATNDASRATAAGVLAGLRGLSRALFGDEQLGGRSYVVQGLGGVGAALASALVSAGGDVRGWDPDPGARARAEAIGVTIIPESALFCTACDVFVPCALGQILSVERCRVGPWRAVCGAANNQLADPVVARILDQRGIVWAPDFAVNAGAVIEGVETVLGDPAGARARVDAGIEAIAGRVAGILEQAAAEHRTTLEVALERAAQGTQR